MEQGLHVKVTLVAWKFEENEYNNVKEMKSHILMSTNWDMKNIYPKKVDRHYCHFHYPYLLVFQLASHEIHNEKEKR